MVASAEVTGNRPGLLTAPLVLLTPRAMTAAKMAGVGGVSLRPARFARRSGEGIPEIVPALTVIRSATVARLSNYGDMRLSDAPSYYHYDVASADPDLHGSVSAPAVQKRSREVTWLEVSMRDDDWELEGNLVQGPERILGEEYRRWVGNALARALGFDDTQDPVCARRVSMAIAHMMPAWADILPYAVTPAAEPPASG